MLFIHGLIGLGGIETFYLRMAKERKNKGLKTSLLLLKSEFYSSKHLLCEMRLYAEVYFLDDFFFTHSSFSHSFILLLPPKKSKIEKLMEDVDQIHSSGGVSSFVGQRLLKISNKKIPITVGVYHSLEYLWGGDKVPYYVRVDRSFIFNYLPKESILFFSEGNRSLYSEKTNINFNKSQTFRLGVVDRKYIDLKYRRKKHINIVAVGRLVKFKSYNIFMIDVIKELISKGYKVNFQIYGEGPLFNLMKEKIQEVALEPHIKLLGNLDYSRFDEIVSQADLFIGSGTSIIQAASLGIPSIVGIENINEPKAYGYFSELFQYEYNMMNSKLPLLDVSKIIENYINMEEVDRIGLIKNHLRSINDFTNSSCQNKLNKLNAINMPELYYRFNCFLYEISRFTSSAIARIDKNARFNNRYEDTKNMSS